jgi:hypothetical protein
MFYLWWSTIYRFLSVFFRLDVFGNIEIKGPRTSVAGWDGGDRAVRHKGVSKAKSRD